MANPEETVLTTFRQLPKEKQQEVLDFLAIIQDISPLPPTKEELEQANQIITRGLQRARTTPPKLPQQIWSEFEEVVAKISAQYHEKQPSN
jgi:hypothetical protein